MRLWREVQSDGRASSRRRASRQGFANTAWAFATVKSRTKRRLQSCRDRQWVLAFGKTRAGGDWGEFRPQEFANTAWAFATARRAEERCALWRPRAWAEGVCMCLGGRRRRQGGSHISSFCVWRRMSTASRLLKTFLESSRLAQTSSCRPASALVSPIRRGPCLTGHFSCRCAVQAQGPLTLLTRRG